MGGQGYFEKISDYCEKKGCTIKTDESLAGYTTFKIGGKARLAVFPSDAGELADIINIIKAAGADYILLGGGSNVLICENFFDGAAVITSQMKNVKIDGETLYADCGVSLTRLAGLARDNSLSGLEFAYGIPGTLGGAVCMNAGAYGGQIGSCLHSSRFINTQTLKTGVLEAGGHEFAYRESVYGKNRDLIMLSAVLELKRRDFKEISAVMDKNMSERKEKQPLEYPSAGSVFKRGEDFYASRLIDECGLKGLSAGGARVSEKHAGFIINNKNAGFSDVKSLISLIKSEVFAKTGKNMECEIKIIEF